MFRTAVGADPIVSVGNGLLGMADILAFAFGFAWGSALAPTPLARAEPVPARRSAAVTGFLPSSTTAAADIGGTGADLALGAAPALAGPVLAGTALAGLRVLTPCPPDPVNVAALLVGAAGAVAPPWVVAAVFFCSSAFGASSRDFAAADTSAGFATGTTLGAWAGVVAWGADIVSV